MITPSFLPCIDAAQISTALAREADRLDRAVSAEAKSLAWQRNTALWLALKAAVQHGLTSLAGTSAAHLLLTTQRILRAKPSAGPAAMADMNRDACRMLSTVEGARP